MRVVGVSHVLNEADIIEPFVRHHAALLDLHIILDNGSTDATVEILRSLHGEGLKLQVYQAVSPIFIEQLYNTGLYQLALNEGADWVAFLDADELLGIRGADRLEPVLALVPDEVVCLRLSVLEYPVIGIEGEGHPFLRLRTRYAAQQPSKIIARRFDPARISIYAGSFGLFVDNVNDQGMSQDRLFMAHMPARSPLQVARKAVLSRLKVMATGAAQANFFSTHNIATYEALTRDARGWLAEAEAPPTRDTVEDPFPYRGTALRYTTPPDELARLISLFATGVETLAKSHGDILDRKRLIRREVTQQAAKTVRLF